MKIPLNLIPTILTKIFVRIIYNFFCLVFPVKKKKVTFASYRTESIQGNLLYLHNELNRQYPDYSLICLFKKFNSSKSGRISYLFHMLVATYHLATSSCFFIDDYYFPVYLIKPRKDTKIVQAWHAAGAFKKFGYSTVGKKFGPSLNYLKQINIHSNYSNVIVSSNEIAPFYSEAFNMPLNKILPLGLPRSDFFFNPKNHVVVKDKFYNDFPEIKGKKIILYAPTYRGKSHNQNKIDLKINFKLLKGLLSNEYIIIVHLHPYITECLHIDEDIADFVYYIESKYMIDELLLLADMLITDYSSIIFDFSLLRRPIAFLAEDLADYTKERDFYYDYKSFVPGPIFENTQELGDWIIKGTFDIGKVSYFKDRFLNNCDGNVSKRVVEVLFKE